MWCASTNALVTNCLIVGNSALEGGGAFGGTLYNCTLIANSAPTNGVQGTGGGAYGCTLYNCTLTGNSVPTNGYFGEGGGAYGCVLYNCTLTGNWDSSGGGGCGDQDSPCALYNCIAYYNAGSPNYFPSTTLNYCCTTPMPTNGVGNITNAPLFVDYANGNLRLQSNSPCIDTGSNAYVTAATDLDGRPRIVGRTVDMGAYEFQPGVERSRCAGWTI